MSEKISNTILNIIQPNIPLFIRALFVLFALIFFIFIIYFLKKTSWFGKIFLRDFLELVTFSSVGISKSREAFKKIMERLKSQNEDDAKLAIIEADDLLNESLNRIGYNKEETLGEKIEKISLDVIPNLEELIKVHKIRNDIIHYPAYRLNLEEAVRILSVYEKTLHNLETL